jgi:hypothetical protein
MPALRRWKPNLALRKKPMTLRLLPKQLLISRKNWHWLRRRKRRRPWLMLRKNIVCESKLWLSDFRRCLLLVRVSTRLVLFFDFCCVLALANAFLSFFFLVPFVLQDLPGCHCRLCNQAMIL